MSSEIFISYSSKEEAEARRVKQVLEDNGFSCWMAPDSIPSGSNYKLQIPDAIRNCRAVVFIMSENSQKSIWVQKEITDAINQKKLIIPYMIQNCALQEDFNFILNDIQQVPAYKDEEAALKKVIHDIRNVLNVRDDEEVVITVRKRKPMTAIIAAALLIAAILITFAGIRIFRLENEEIKSGSAAASVYYSEILPYTQAGYYASFEDTSGIVKNSLNANFAFSILSFVRNAGDQAAFVESISCDLLEVNKDESSKVIIDAWITEDNILKVFAVNNGWGDSGEISYSMYIEPANNTPEFPVFSKELKTEGTCSVKRENAELVGEYPLNIDEISEWAASNVSGTTASIAYLNIVYNENSEEKTYFAYMVYHTDTDTITLDYGGKGDNIDYSVTLYAMLDVDHAPSSIRFTGSSAAPLVHDTFRIETVIIPTKSVNLKCQGVYSIQGNEQKTDIYDVHVNVPVFKPGYFETSGAGTRKLSEISMDNEQAVQKVLDEARYDPESILDEHLEEG